MSRCKRNSNGWTTHQPPPIYTGNPFDNEKVAIPDGPLVDPCEKPLSRLSKKIKSKFPSMDSSTARPEDIYPHTVTVDYSTDDTFMHRLRNMSRNSQSMFLNLAKKFNMSKKPSALMPNSYDNQFNDFSYDIHRSESSQNTSKFH